MQQSSISAVFGALSNEMRLNIIANNLANANTAGYKGDTVAFQDVFRRIATDANPDPRGDLSQKILLPRPIVVAKPRVAEQTVDMTQGSLENTQNPFDLAITGPGFFRVMTPQGVFLTRNGQFYRDSGGQLVTNQGYPVMGVGGPVIIPEGKTVVVNASGNVLVDNQVVATVEVTDADPKTLKKVGSSLFTGISGAPNTRAIVPGETIINQGYLEKPNVQVVAEMVNMIDAHRSYEAYSKIITTSQEMDQSAITKVGETR